MILTSSLQTGYVKSTCSQEKSSRYRALGGYLPHAQHASGLLTRNLPRGLGHLAVQFAHAMGHPTIALSSGAAKGELALRLGAVEYADGSQVDQAAVLQKHGGAKLIMCTASAPEATKKLIPGLAVDGTLLLLAVSNEEFGVSPSKRASPSYPRGGCASDHRTRNTVALLRQRFSIKGLPHGLPMEIEECVAFAKLHNIKAMVERFPLAQTPEASRRRESARFRAVIVP